jgi:NRPS condensation-like uncharacterized protein
VPERVPVTAQDRVFIQLDRPGEPWTVHVEAWIGGRLDAERLNAAVAAAVERHPMTRAALRDGDEWEIASRIDPPSVRVVECGDESELGRLREQLLCESPSIERPPPFSLVLARSPDRDALILSQNHSVADGVGAVRLLSSIFRAYAGEPDPVPDVDPLRMRDMRSFAARWTLGDRVRLLRERLEQRKAPQDPSVHIAPSGSRPDGIAGLRLIRFDPAQLESAQAARVPPATFNDLLLASLALTVRRWNDERGEPPGSVWIRVPINIRPREWSTELMANLAATFDLRVPAEALTDLRTAQLAVAGRTRPLKEQRFADLLAGGGVIPLWVRRFLRKPTHSTADIRETALLSNLGQPELPARLGPDLPLEAVWFSPPIRMPRSLRFGVVTTGTGLFVVVRYGPELFDAASAEAFSDRFADILVGG